MHNTIVKLQKRGGTKRTPRQRLWWTELVRSVLTSVVGLAFLTS